MRRPAISHSALRHPLDTLLGRTAFVRILRLLTRERQAFVQAEVARRTRLSKAGVSQAIDDLADLGLLEISRPGNQVLVTLRADHPLAEPLSAIFAAEEQRFERLLDGLREAVTAEEPRVRAAWIEGPVARGEDTVHDPVVLGILTTARVIDEVGDRIQRSADHVGGVADTRVHLRRYTRFELETELAPEDAAEVLPLYGPPPWAFQPGAEGEPHVTSHEDLDRASLAMGRAIAERLKQDPALVERALAWLDDRLERGAGAAEAELREWRTLLATRSVARLRDLLAEDSERATRLRQSNPLAGVLSAQERDELRGQVLTTRNEHDQG